MSLVRLCLLLATTTLAAADKAELKPAVVTI
ncbi:MAG: hypothetical protein RL749_928, partial [Verrucomicrobiota bacterium]